MSVVNFSMKGLLFTFSLRFLTKNFEKFTAENSFV